MPVEPFIYTLTPIRSDMLSEGLTDKENKIVGAHFEYLSGLKEQGAAKLFPFRIALMGNPVE